MSPRNLTAVFATLLTVAAVGPSHGLEHLTATIDGTQEVPATGSPGTGTAQCLIDTATNTVFYHVDFSGLGGTEIASHIHGFATPGVNAGVLQALPAGSPKIGAWVYAEVNEANILAGLTYVNIHSTLFGGGEIRGQLIANPATDFVALIEQSQEVPPTGSTGQGIGVFDIDTAANTLSYDIRFGNLVATQTAAHIHGYVAPGVNGGVVFGLGVGSPQIGVWNYLEANEANILAGLTYVNIHSASFGAGEIRGQILPVTSSATDAPLLGADSGTLSFSARPNPVPDGSTVALLYRLPAPGEVSITIHDVSGRVIRTLGTESDGSGILAWDTRDQGGQRVSAGVYFARLETKAGRETRRVVVLR